jgi:hypothetical protein
MVTTTFSSAFFSLPSSWARLGSFQTAGSSSSALTSLRRRDFSSQSKIPPKFGGPLNQIGDLGADGVDVFDVHGESCAKNICVLQVKKAPQPVAGAFMK